MVSLYKRLFITYFFVGVLCMIGGYAFLTRFPNLFIVYFVSLLTILGVTITILHKISRKKFEEEVMTHLHNCRVGIFIEEVTNLMGKRRGRQVSSFYASLCAIGYDILGDYDALYASCQNIKLKMHMPIYHRRMFSYYFNNKELEHAINEADTLAALAAKEKNLKEKKVIEDMEAACRRTLRVNDGDYDEALNFYSEMLKSTEPQPLITRVSSSYAYGKLLYLTGEEEKAKEPLLFASSRGGDTRYKKTADKILEKINGNKEN